MRLLRQSETRDKSEEWGVRSPSPASALEARPGVARPGPPPSSLFHLDIKGSSPGPGLPSLISSYSKQYSILQNIYIELGSKLPWHTELVLTAEPMLWNHDPDDQLNIFLIWFWHQGTLWWELSFPVLTPTISGLCLGQKMFFEIKLPLMVWGATMKIRD